MDKKKVQYQVLTFGLAAILAIGMKLGKDHLFPSPSQVIEHSLDQAAKNNALQAKITITNDMKIDSKNAEGQTSNVFVRTEVPYFAYKNRNYELKGTTNIVYKGIAERKNHFYITGRTAKNGKQYVYYSGSPIKRGYESDYDNWSVQSLKNDTRNLPEALAYVLSNMTDASMNKDRTKINGHLAYKDLVWILNYANSIDQKNTNMMQMLDVKEKDIKAELVLGKSGAMKTISLCIKNASIEETKRIPGTKINELNIKIQMQSHEVKKNIKVASDVTKNVTKTEVDIPLPQIKKTTDVPKDKTSKFASLEDMHILFDGQKIKELNQIADLINLSKAKYKKLSLSDSMNMMYTNLKADENAKVYIYTDEIGEAEEIEIDNSYATTDHVNITVNGVIFGIPEESLRNTLGEPNKEIQNKDGTVLEYNVGNKEYVVSFIFFKDEKGKRNNGLQKIDFRKITHLAK
ncbi:hypothetical protein SAMN05216391_11911 [Lachnospiraceae bacterium KHCPX20]|nr:hypothetical protein SAMN05216391_11911 [Lachnospiraceae bacterium KHCPX20]